jgi:O-antigen/teichoic acid export membrane protein
MAAAIPLAVAILVGGEFLLAQIGPEFTEAMPLVIILTFGQFAYAVFGPPGMVLAMSGHERINLAITTGGTVMMLAAAPLGAWLAGAEGLVASMVLVMLARNIVAYLIVRHKMGISIWAGTA